jgi:hypothetical protein
MAAVARRIQAMSIDAERRAERIRREVTGWRGVTTAAGDYGETDFVINGRSIGHVHGGHQADIPSLAGSATHSSPPAGPDHTTSIPTRVGPRCTSAPTQTPTMRSSCCGSTTTASSNAPRLPPRLDGRCCSARPGRDVHAGRERTVPPACRNLTLEPVSVPMRRVHSRVSPCRLGPCSVLRPPREAQVR